MFFCIPRLSCLWFVVFDICLLCFDVRLGLSRVIFRLVFDNDGCDDLSAC